MKKKPLNQISTYDAYLNTGVIAIIILLLILLATKPGQLNPCNQKSNTTEPSEKYLLGKCYGTYTEYYQTKEYCQRMFFKSCYESSTPHLEKYTVTYCYKAKTGEKC